MLNTFTILNNEVTESTKRDNIYSILQNIPDNTQKLISPKDIRDGFLTTWSNITFKLTSNSNDKEYIGIDSSNPNNRDIKNKILIGKRNVGSSDIMSDSLINTTDGDIYFYNTKKDSEIQNSTKVSFLAGTNKSLFFTAPYIESKYNNNKLELNIVNTQDSINILSENDRVSINNISFPTVTENQSFTDLNGKILKYKGNYPNGYLEWSDSISSDVTIGDSNTDTYIVGDGIFLNGYSLEFIEDKQVNEKIGGIEIGQQFLEDSFSGQNWPITEVLRELIYPYIEPNLELNIINNNSNNKFAIPIDETEINIDYSFTTYARDTDEKIINYEIKRVGRDKIKNGNVNTLETPGTITSENDLSDTIDLQDKNIGDKINYELSVVARLPNDTTTQTFTLTDTITIIQPILFGFIDDISKLDLLSIISDSNSVIVEGIKDGIEIDIQYNSNIPGKLFFAYGFRLPEIKMIKDPNGYIIYDSNNKDLSIFTKTEAPIVLGDPYGSFKIYYTKFNVSYTAGGKFKFIF